MHALRRQCLLLHRLGLSPNPRCAVDALPYPCRMLSIASAHFTRRSHYDVLEITPRATQADVKSAYYRMSMLHHPDRNKGDADSADKFRAVTAAYEVLSNYRLRRLYDKGVGQNPEGFDTANTHRKPDADVGYDEDPVEDDAQTKFYKRHMTRSEKPHSSGRTPIYNFDEWTEAHYGTVFERKQAAQTQYRTQKANEKRAVDGLQSEVIVFVLLFACVALFFVCFQLGPDPDKVSSRKKV